LKGRDIFFAYLEHNGVPFLFGNPGTTELPLVDGCNDHPAVRYVMALHEDIAVAMAMGYARASGSRRRGEPPRRAGPRARDGQPLQRVPRGHAAHRHGGQQHTRLVVHDPILTADLAAMARPFTKWSYDVRFVEELPTVMQRAFKEATTAPTGPVFISLPMDVLLETVNFDPPVAASTIASTIADPRPSRTRRASSRRDTPDDRRRRRCRPVLRLAEVVAIAERLGAPVYTEQYSTIWNFPSDHPHFAGPMPNQAVAMRQRFEGVDVALLAGFTAQAPVARFDEKGSLIPPSVQIVAVHDRPWEIGKNQPAMGFPARSSTTSPRCATRSAPRRTGRIGAWRGGAWRVGETGCAVANAGRRRAGQGSTHGDGRRRRARRGVPAGRHLRRRVDLEPRGVREPGRVRRPDRVLRWQGPVARVLGRRRGRAEARGAGAAGRDSRRRRLTPLLPAGALEPGRARAPVRHRRAETTGATACSS
jgi:hypothetical protein